MPVCFSLVTVVEDVMPEEDMEEPVVEGMAEETVLGELRVNWLE